MERDFELPSSTGSTGSRLPPPTEAQRDAVIAEFRQVIADAEAAIRTIERLHRPHSNPSDSVSVPNRIREFLEKSPQASFTTEEIAAGIGSDVNHRTLTGALLRMAGTRIERRERGKYGAV